MLTSLEDINKISSTFKGFLSIVIVENNRSKVIKDLLSKFIAKNGICKIEFIYSHVYPLVSYLKESIDSYFSLIYQIKYHYL